MRPLRRGERAADTNQADVTSPGSKRGENLDQHVDAFSRNGRAHVQQLDAATESDEPRCLRVGCRVGLCQPADLGSVRNDRQSIAGNIRQPHQRQAGGIAVTRNVCGTLQPLENPPRHPLERHRAPLFMRLEDRPERVDVMARDEGPLVRQVVHQVRVRMIDHVIHVELTNDGGQGPRVVPLPRHEAIER